MISLLDFIKESLEDNDIQNLEVTYNMNNQEPIIVEAPETYSEDDVTLYIQDVVFDSLPGGKDMVEKFFGVNAKKLIDVHIEYDTFQHSNECDNQIDIKWDNKFNIKNSSEDSLSYFSISDVKYILTFESFTIKKEDNSDVNEILTKIFSVTESSLINKYPISIKLSNVKFDEQ